MPSTSTSLPSSNFPEKLETCLGKPPSSDSGPETLQISLVGDEVCDPFATSGSSFDWADDVEHEFYAAPDSRDTDTNDYERDVSLADIRASTLSIDRFFASDTRTFGESGSSLSATGEVDESDISSSATDSADARSLADRIFAGGPAPSRYRVASVPSLGAIEEDDESELRGEEEEVDRPQTASLCSDSDESASTACSNTEHSDVVAPSRFDSLHFSLAPMSTLDEDDLDSSWVWIDIEDGQVDESRTVPQARRCEPRDWRWYQLLRRFFAL
ncbi:hypothetical protein LXA43DRAFT_236194 [Ganoderma leucocontextum]|nr:hypothetical protein LXA43DRAFT_236194 [Ganoderma leucocontextum]